MMITKLARYIIKTTLLAMSAGVFGLLLLQMIFAYLGELENLSDSYSFVDAFFYIVYRSPYFLVEFVGAGVLLGAVIGLGLLSASSELVVIRAAGISLFGIIRWTMMPALLFVALSLGVNEWILPISNQKAAILQGNSNPSHTSLMAIDGYWQIIPTQMGKQIVYIGLADNQGNLTKLKQFDVMDNNLTVALWADRGQFVGGSDGYGWRLFDVSSVHFGTNANAYHLSQHHLDASILSLPISKDSIHLLTREPDDLSISDLYDHQQLMKHQNNRSLRHELVFWQKLLSPFSILSLLLIACSFVFGSLRSQSLGLRVVIALIMGILLSYLSDLSGFIVLLSGLSPFVMTLLPIVLSAMIGMYLLTKKG